MESNIDRQNTLALLEGEVVSKTFPNSTIMIQRMGEVVSENTPKLHCNNSKNDGGGSILKHSKTTVMIQRRMGDVVS